MKINVQNLTGVSETLLFTFYMRYRESIKYGGLIKDTRYQEIIDNIDYDYTELARVPDSFTLNIVFRTNVIDGITKQFIEKNPLCTIVSLASGLDFRHERVDNGQLVWFDIELPHVIELRKLLFREGPRLHLISSSVLDCSWMNCVPHDKPVLFIAEGLFMYLEKDEVKDFFLHLARHFPGSEIVFDANGTLNHQVSSSGSPYPPINRMYRQWKWAMSDWSEIEAWGPFELIYEYIPDIEITEEEVQDITDRLPSMYRGDVRDVADSARQRLEQSYRVGHVRMGKKKM